MKSGGPGFRMGGPMEGDLGGDFEGMGGYGSYRRQPFGPDYGGYGQMGGGRYEMGGRGGFGGGYGGYGMQALSRNRYMAVKN
uniref:Uncharacterized protein n=1 Tax=Acrobeloides nanus TaxID=290746 RepID=A0A914CZC2_9BILA